MINVNISVGFLGVFLFFLCFHLNSSVTHRHASFPYRALFISKDASSILPDALVI